jgi:hypothetical protein
MRWCGASIINSERQSGECWLMAENVHVVGAGGDNNAITTVM